MPSLRINKEIKDRIYFVTLTIKNWYYIFDRHNRFQILENSFVYCQKNKIDVIRDMKTFLSKELQRNIIATEPTILKIFKNNGKYNFWQNNNYPEIIESEKFLIQKANYIHNNPVRKQYVNYPEDWIWSSASKVPTRIQIAKI